MIILMDDFLIRAALAGLLVAAISGPLGAFVVWRRMAYFGATLSHSALLGIALGLLLGISPIIGMVAVGVAIALMLALGSGAAGAKHLSEDTLLGIFAHGALALGLVVIALINPLRFDLMAYLFGDILAVSTDDLVLLAGGGILLGGLLMVLWRPLLTLTVDAELAQVEGINVVRVRLVLMLMLAVLVALAMKVVGVLLVTSLLIIPAATARPLSRSPHQMAILAAVCGGASVIGGLAGSYVFDPPSGPSIVVAAMVLFAFSRMINRR
ncbi:MAG TPA: hypothetical protein ENI69_11605 [Rhodospirillales bacterium]|nr:hypothetical protein [Rhodospirillales bacterium]